MTKSVRSFEDRGAYLLKPEELDKVRGIILKDGRLNADIVGQPVTRLAELAGIEISRLGQGDHWRSG